MGDSWSLRPARSEDFGWIVERHGDLYRLERGWDERFESLVAGVVSDFVRDFDPVRERAWIAELDGRRVGYWQSCWVCAGTQAVTRWPSCRTRVW
jgi:hypothetical protein